ncbi:unnamed protein product [Porites lobata]|uniref:Uncharacterized protein n=1 Tax=Porites lobata TaxID=104759 RepID=A0ABN8RYA4_9CNID|nr:unnamed protein product [Porites lobata]
MICWFSILPADVLKSRVQIAPEGKYPRGVRDAFIALVRNESFASLYKGLTPVLMRAFAVNGGVFFGYEVALIEVI